MNPSGSPIVTDPRDFAGDEALLTSVLHDVVRASDGAAAVALLDEAVQFGRAVRDADPQRVGRLRTREPRGRPARKNRRRSGSGRLHFMA